MEAKEARLWALRVEKANEQAAFLINELDARLDEILVLVSSIKQARAEDEGPPPGMIA